MEPIVVLKALEQIQVDLINMRHEPSGTYKWILHIKDHFTKFSRLYPLHSKCASGVADKIMLFIQHYGSPDICQADNGKEFKGALLILLKRTGTKIINGRPRQPQTQGLVEQGNSVVKDKLRKWKQHSGSSQWHNGLFDIVRQINAQTHTSLPWGWNPYFAFFNRHPRPLKNIRRMPNKDDIDRLDTLEQRVNTLASKIGNTGSDDSEWNTFMTELPFESIIDNADQEELDHNNCSQMQQTIASNPSFNPIMQRSISPAKAMYEHSPPIVAPLAGPIVPIMVNAMDKLTPDDQTRIEAAHREPILKRQVIVRQKMAEAYNRKHEIIVYSLNDYVTVKVPREDRTATDNLRLFGRIIEVPKNNRYKIQCEYGVLDRLYSTKDLNKLSDQNQSTIAERFKNAPFTPVTIHAAAAKRSTSNRVPTSCACKKGCKTLKCVCIKRKVDCSQYCHGEDRCTNAGTILEGTNGAIVTREGTEEAIVIRVSSQCTDN